MSKNVASNCPVSQPILLPDTELVPFNGLAWSNLYGIIPQSSTIGQQESAQWLGTQE